MLKTLSYVSKKHLSKQKCNISKLQYNFILLADKYKKKFFPEEQKYVVGKIITFSKIHIARNRFHTYLTLALRNFSYEKPCSIQHNTWMSWLFFYYKTIFHLLGLCWFYVILQSKLLLLHHFQNYIVHLSFMTYSQILIDRCFFVL